MLAHSRLLDRLLFAALLLCVFVPVLPAHAATASYTVVDLGTLGGSDSLALGINTGGDVVGSSRTATGVRHAFLYAGGAMSDLGTLGGAESSASAINDSGQVVGESTTATGETHAFLWSGGVMTDLGTLGGTYSSAAAINASGDIVGASTTASGERHAFVYSGDVMNDLGTFGGVHSTATGINDNGDVVGTWTKAGGEFGSFLHSGGSTTILEAPRAGAEDVNDSRQITGAMPTPVTTAQHAFLYSNGVTTDLGTLDAASFGQAVNNAGVVVGYNLNTQGGFPQAFSYSDAVMRPLTALLPGDSGWTDLRNASDINDGGQIVGYGLRSGQFHAFLLTPSAGPAVVLAGKPGDPSASSSASFVFSSPDPGAGFECKLADGAYAACTSPQGYSGLADGRHSFFVRAKNAAGTVGPTETYSWTVDTVGPSVTIFNNPLQVSASTGAAFDFMSEAGATFECKLDDGVYAACTTGQRYAGLANGVHTFSARATDLAGNVGPAATFTWTIDATGPPVTLSGKPGDPSTSADASFVFSSDAGATFECSLDGGAYATCASPQAYCGLSAGVHTFSVRATDTQGRVGPVATYSWTINITPAPIPPPRGQSRVQGARDALVLKKAQVPEAAQLYVQLAIDALNRALEPSRWISDQPRLSAESRDTLSALRDATGWLYWADADVRAATAAEQDAIIRGMGELVRQRFDQVFHFVGEGGGADPWALWASEYLLNEGDRQLADGWPLGASMYYTTGWDYLLNQPPCC